MAIKSETLGLCRWKFWNFLFSVRLSNGESSRILKFLTWHGFDEIHQIHVKFGWNDRKQKIVVTKGTSKNSWIFPLPHCSLTKTISHTFGSALTAHHYLLYKETLTIINCATTPTSALGAYLQTWKLISELQPSSYIKVKHVLTNHKCK